ncbi:hypothetical protein QJS10_CPA06g01464 [Acorus calamus]|uniref:Uncharacterized protein n=1 Tax=Acorus calamus TaxID=4465 RepID=A0AAV9EN25_ACOCL|nr:hypothetical protein QJS10_CPA06g01464 [Acorus calamus]
MLCLLQDLLFYHHLWHLIGQICHESYFTLHCLLVWVEVKGSTLTDGARALAKHVDRSKDGWWGSFRGSDADKNKHALEVINHLLVNCCWMNVHMIQPYGAVFELRVTEGYGARWSKDGSSFIGFLEPYMVEGHLKRWRH